MVLVLIIILNIYLLLVLLRTVYTLCVGYLYTNTSIRKKIKDYNPLVSVIIPAYNEQVGIEKTVRSVLRNNYRNLEVIVVNDGSKDNTWGVITKLLKVYKRRLILIDKENGGKATALNAGIIQSKGGIIVTIDADSYIYPDAIGHLVHALSNPNIDCAVGSIVIGNKKTLVGKIQYFEYKFGFHTKKSQSILNSIYVLPGALCAVKRKIFDKVGIYESYSKTEDFDMSLKMRAIGANIIHVDEAICITEGASDFKSLINQRTRWRHGGIMCLKKHRKLIFNRNHKDKYLSFVELPLVIFGLFEIFIYPLIMLYIFWSMFTTQNPFNLLIYYMIMPFTFYLLLKDELKSDPKLIIYLIFVPFVFTIIALVEFVALIKSLHKLIFRKEMQWGNWVRVGV